MPRGDRIKEDPTIKAKLEQAFAIGCTDEEACIVAGISKGTLYGYIEQDPDFHERKEELKQFPVIKAKHSVVSRLKKDVATSKWYLERKTKEFKPPDRQGNLILNQLNILTDNQLKDRLANKLNKLFLKGPDNGDNEADNVINVTDNGNIDSDS